MSGDYSFLKRRDPPAPLDRDNLNATFAPEPHDPRDIATQIRRPGAADEEAVKPVQNPNFKFFQTANTGGDTGHSAGTAPPVSFFTQSHNRTEPAQQSAFFVNKPKSPEKAVDQNKEGRANTSISSSLFFNKAPEVHAKPPTTETAGTFFVKSSIVDPKTMFAGNGIQENAPEKPKVDPKPTEQPKEEEKKPPSIFGSLAPPQGATNSFFTSSGTSSIFGNLGKEEKKPEDKAAPAEPKKGGLFDNLETKQENKPTSFFGSGVTVTKTGLFDGLLNSGVSNNTGCGTNLFNHTSTPLTGMFANTGGATGGEDDEEEIEGDEDEVPGQDDATDPTKSTGNYKYEETTTVITSVPVVNFKVDTVPGMGAGSASLEKIKEKTNVIIFRNGAKVILHTSFLVPKLSRVGLMSGRNDAIWIETATYEGDKPKKTLCKMQFHDDKAAADFKKAVESLVN